MQQLDMPEKSNYFYTYSHTHLYLYKNILNKTNANSMNKQNIFVYFWFRYLLYISIHKQ